MHFGIMTPVVGGTPPPDPPAWEAEATIADLAAVAKHADRLGYEFLTFPEHVAIPEEVVSQRGGAYWAPLPTMGYLAACTSRIRLATYVLVLGYHHPLELVKSYGTLDRICGGRLIMGVGVGSLEAEFDLLGAAFPDRGARADDALRALRASWSTPNSSYRGSHHAWSGWVVEPCGLDRHVPIWVGGRSRRSLRRALELGDAWAPFGLPPAVVGEMLSGVIVPAGFDVVLHPEPPVDPLGEPEAAAAAVRTYQAAGATQLVLRFRQDSLGHLLEQMEALMALEPVEPG